MQRIRIAALLLVTAALATAAILYPTDTDYRRDAYADLVREAVGVNPTQEMIVSRILLLETIGRAASADPLIGGEGMLEIPFAEIYCEVQDEWVGFSVPHQGPCNSPASHLWIDGTAACETHWRELMGDREAPYRTRH